MNRFNPNEASIVNKDNIYELIGFVLQEDFIWDFTPFISLRRTKPNFLRRRTFFFVSVSHR